MVILLDPRSLLPLDVNVEKAFEDSGAASVACEKWCVTGEPGVRDVYLEEMLHR